MGFDPHRYAVARVEAGDVASDRQLLYRWHGNHWSVLEEDQGEREAYHWLVTHDREHTSAENARRAHRATLLYAPPLPAPSAWLIPCRNGYVRLGPVGPERVPAEPAAGMRYVLGAAFRPEEGFGQRFPAFLERVLPDPAVRERVQEYAGYTLTADARHQRAQLWLGRGANGKGVLSNILQALHQRVAAVSLEALDGFRLSGLVGASLVVADEVPHGRVNEQLLKSLIAGECVLVDRKHRDPLSLSLQGKWLVLGNQLPKISDHSLGFWRRWDLVPFNVTIPEGERNPLLAQQIIEEELSGVLNWALAGLQRLQARGRFDPVLPPLMQGLLGQAKAETNPVQAWLDEREARLGGAPTVLKDLVYQDYRRWCETNGLAPLAAPRFWPRLRDLLPYQEERQRQGSRQVRVCNLLLAP